MLRELLELGWLEDFLRGAARAVNLRASAFDENGRLIAAAPPVSEFARLTGQVLGTLPVGLQLVPQRTDEQPASIGFVEDRGLWYVVAPVHVDDLKAGYVAIGELRGPEPPAEIAESTAELSPAESAARNDAWKKLPLLERFPDAVAVSTARWAARMLSDWCRRESRIASAAEHLLLVGDVAEMITGEGDLQRILDRIVAETSRVMRCRFCSLRLYNPQTDELIIKAVHSLSRAYIEKGPVTRQNNAIDREALAGQMVYVEDMARDPRVRYPDEARREGIVSSLSAGMFYRGQPVGVIRVYTDHRFKFRRLQQNLLRAVASQAATAIVQARLMQERLRTTQTERELKLAGDVQRRMVRTPPPPHAHIQSAMVYRPSSHVSGDLCDFLTLADGRMAAVVADVSGKGVPASLLMASVRGALRMCAQLSNSPAEILDRLNQHVLRETSSSEFVTFLLIAIDAAGRELTYANAGHEPVLRRRGGVIEGQSEGGLVLGVSANERYEDHKVEMRPGDFFLLYTDGAIDASNFGGELYGRARLAETLAASGHLPPKDALAAIQWEITRFIGLAEQADDLTLIGLCVND